MTASLTNELSEHQWHNLAEQEVARRLDTNLDTGLTAALVTKKRERFGSNELKSKPGKSPLVRFFLQFNQPLLYILLIAGAIKALLGQWVNAWVIWGVTLINAIIGFVQESKAESAIAQRAVRSAQSLLWLPQFKQTQLSSATLKRCKFLPPS